MRKTLAIIAGSLLFGAASYAVAEPSQQVAQAQIQDRDQIERDYQNRLNAARTPEERARIQAERDRMLQQGAVPNSGSAVRTAPGTAGSGTMPERFDGGTQAGQSPGGGGSVPSGQSD